MINEAENFFKHADRDADRTLLFHTAQTELPLWDACRAYQLLTSEVIPALGAYVYWVLLERPRARRPEEVPEPVALTRQRTA